MSLPHSMALSQVNNLTAVESKMRFWKCSVEKKWDCRLTFMSNQDGNLIKFAKIYYT